MHDVFELPDVTSRTASPTKFVATAHNLGARCPSGGKPLLRRWSSKSEKMPATIGDDWLVPSIDTAEISGYARPLLLNDAAGGRPVVLAR